CLCFRCSLMIRRAPASPLLPYTTLFRSADEVFGNSAAMALFQGQISRAHGRLQVVDVSDLEHPKSVAWYEPEFGGVHNVWVAGRSEEHTSELQSLAYLVCRLLLEKKKKH